MSIELKRTITSVAKGLSVVAFLTTAYLTFNTNMFKQKLKDIGPITQSYKGCNERVQQTGESFLNSKLAHASMTASFVKGSSDCLKRSGEDLSRVGGLSASMMNAVVAYSKNVGDLHKLVLRPKNKDTHQLLKEKISSINSSYSEVTKEFYNTQKYFLNKSSFINNNFYLLSIGTLFMSLIINLLSWRSKKSDLTSQVEREASELSLSGKFDNGQEVEAFVSKSLKTVGLHNVENLLSNYLKHRLKKHAMEMKFDKIDELTASSRYEEDENEDLEKITEVVNNVNSKLDLLDSLTVNLKKMQSEEGESELGKKLEDILNVVRSTKSGSEESDKNMSENTIFILNRINELEEENNYLKKNTIKKIEELEKENIFLKEDTIERIGKLEKENSSLKGQTAQKINKIEREYNLLKDHKNEQVESASAPKREVSSIQTSTDHNDLETCVLSCVNEVSASEASRNVKFDVCIDSGISLGKSREGVIKIIRELISQSIENNKDIVENKVLTIKSKAISSGVLLNCTMKQVDTIEDLESMKLSSQNFHMFDPIADTNTEMISSHFSRLTDINGETIGTRYNFCLELEYIESKVLPQAPSLFNN